MPQVKRFIKQDIVQSIEQLVKLHYKTFIINRNNKDIVIEYAKLKHMTLATIVNMIDNKELWFTIVAIENVTYTPKKKVAPKAKSDIGACKVNLKDIYDDTKDNC